MRILKRLAGVIGVALLAVVALVFGARFGDGPIAIIPGGPLESGEAVTGAEPDWTWNSSWSSHPDRGRPGFRYTTRDCTSSAHT
jgi:hypothetical protein